MLRLTTGRSGWGAFRYGHAGQVKFLCQKESNNDKLTVTRKGVITHWWHKPQF